MRRLAIGLMLILSAAGCHRESGAIGSDSHRDGRYVDAGIYSPGKLWSHIEASPQPQNAQAATLQDDDEIIVILDSKTGEIGQCGNLSGHCIRMNPWATNSPVNMSAHAEDLEREANEETENSTAN